jgi:hypothetical protein
MTTRTPDRATFCRLYYGEGRSYAEMSAILGVSRHALDSWRRDAGLPSRRWLAKSRVFLRGGARVGGDAEEAVSNGPVRHDVFSGRLRQWRLWRRSSLPRWQPRVVRVRRVGNELYMELG